MKAIEPLCTLCGLPENQPIHRHYPDGPHTHKFEPKKAIELGDAKP